VSADRVRRVRGAGRPRHVGTPEPLIASFRRPLSDPARPP
jgi:hypothetical protein